MMHLPKRMSAIDPQLPATPLGDTINKHCGRLRNHRPTAATNMAAKMQKLAVVVAFLLALIVSGGEAGAGHLWHKHPDDKFLKCSHYCDDELAVCIAEKCAPLHYGKVHNYCHVGCEAKHLVCQKKCVEHSPET